MKNKGFTLIELMLVVLLSSILLLGVMEVYLSLHHTYYIQRKLARLQENGRFAVFYLNQQIHNAGAADCMVSVLGYPSSRLNSYWQQYLNQHSKPNTDAMIISTCKIINGKQEHIQIAYFINKSSTSLYEKYATDERSQELIDDINDMQIKYGVRHNNTLTYLTANAVTNWQSVISVEITLLIQDKKWITYIKLNH